MKILLCANAPWTPSAYSKQASILMKVLKELGHKVDFAADYGLNGGVVQYDGVKVFPVIEGTPVTYAKAFGYDALITLRDVWLPPLNMQHEAFRECRWIPYFPVDCEPLPDRYVKCLEYADRGAVYSKWGRLLLEERGISKVRYIPLVVDTLEFYPVNRGEAREKLGIDKDAVLVSIVADNNSYPSRKAYPQQLRAFQIFAEEVPEAMLYVHATATPERKGLNLYRIVDMLGIKDRVIFAEQMLYRTGEFNNEYLRLVYSASNFLLSVSSGEGFCLPILEAQACGTPVVIGGWHSMPELLLEGVVVSKSEAVPTTNSFGSYWYIPNPNHIAIAMFHVNKRYPNGIRGDSLKRTLNAIRAQYDVSQFKQRWSELLQ